MALAEIALERTMHIVLVMEPIGSISQSIPTWHTPFESLLLPIIAAVTPLLSLGTAPTVQIHIVAAAPVMRLVEELTIS